MFRTYWEISTLNFCSTASFLGIAVNLIPLKILKIKFLKELNPKSTLSDSQTSVSIILCRKPLLPTLLQKPKFESATRVLDHRFFSLSFFAILCDHYMIELCFWDYSVWLVLTDWIFWKEREHSLSILFFFFFSCLNILLLW